MEELDMEQHRDVRLVEMDTENTEDRSVFCGSSLPNIIPKCDVIVTNLPDDNYVLARLREAFKENSSAGQIWMITAKALYPNVFSVQFQAYKIEKASENISQAARCFSDLVAKFQQVPECWEEINACTTALQTVGELDEEKQFYCKMFVHLSSEVQHKLLLIAADYCKDTQEHCKLLLQLLQKFPSAIGTHGMELIEKLLLAEKNNCAKAQPVNIYRKLLICDLIPLLHETGSELDLSSEMVFDLFHKAFDYHLNVLWDNIHNDRENSLKSNKDSWNNLYKLFKFTSKQFGWELSLSSFNETWCKESYWQLILDYVSKSDLDNQDITKQLSYAVAIYLLYCLHQYLTCLNAENITGQLHPSLLLVQGFLNPNLPRCTAERAKRKKAEVLTDGPIINLEKNTLKSIVPNFLAAVSCWEFLQTADSLNREFVRLSGLLNFERWLSTFLVDVLIYKDQHENALKRLDNDALYPLLPKYILKAEIYFLKCNYIVCYEHVRDALEAMDDTMPVGETCEHLTIGGTRRNLHFLPLTRVAITQYLSKFVLHAIRANGFKTDMSVGHCFVLMQIDWPRDEAFLPALIGEICKTRTFYYLLFQTYIVEIDILEELAFLWNSQNGQITYEIVPNMITRRIGTRGADKGIREEIKHTIKRQIEHADVAIHDLIRQFLLQERTHVGVSLV